jgi:hypothetical protein
VSGFVPSKYRPFHIGETDAESGPRIGGVSPKDVEPAFRNQLTRYLLTLPISDGVEISVFYSFDYFSDGPEGFHDAAFIVHDSKSHLAEIVVHSASKRGGECNIPSDIPGHQLEVASSSIEEDFDAESIGYEFHKIGGVPVFTNEFDSNIRSIAKGQIDEGFAHLLQLAFPVGPGDAVVDCNWPFGEAIFQENGVRVQLLD